MRREALSPRPHPTLIESPFQTRTSVDSFLFFFAPAPRPNSRPEFNPNFPKTTKSPVSPFPPPTPLVLNRPLPVFFLQTLKSSYLSLHLSIHSSFHPSIFPSIQRWRKSISIMESSSLIIHPSVRRSGSIHPVIRAILRNARLVSFFSFLQSERGRGSK